MNPLKENIPTQHFIWNRGRYIKATDRQSKFGGKFIKGPIPLEWITTAAKLPGKALHVASVCCYLRGLRQSDTFDLSNTVVRDFGIGPRAKHAGLASLETGGLVRVERPAGRCPRVTLLQTELNRRGADATL